MHQKENHKIRLSCVYLWDLLFVKNTRYLCTVKKQKTRKTVKTVKISTRSASRWNETIWWFGIGFPDSDVHSCTFSRRETNDDDDDDVICYTHCYC